MKIKKILSVLAVILVVSIISPSLLPTTKVQAAEALSANTTLTNVEETLPSLETETALETLPPNAANEENVPTSIETSDLIVSMSEETLETVTLPENTSSEVVQEMSVVETQVPDLSQSQETSVESQVPFFDMDNDFGNFTGIPAAYPLRTARTWEPTTPVAILQGAHMRFFSNIYGTPLQTNEYYLATGEIAYCVDQEAVGPSGQSYAEGNLGDPNYLAAVQAVILSGFPYNNNGLSDQDARYATATAIHWLENYYFGGSEGWNCGMRFDTNANGHDGALQFALALFDIGVAQEMPDCHVQLGAPSAWAKPSGGNYLRTSVYLAESGTTSWTVAAPEGTKIVTESGLVDTFVGTGNATIFLDLVDNTSYINGDKTLRATPTTDKDKSNVKVFVGGGNLQTMAAAKSVATDLDPASKPLPAALGVLTLNKTLTKLDGSTVLESGAGFEIWHTDYADYQTAAAAGAGWTKTTNEMGQIILSDIPLGTYFVKQISSADQAISIIPTVQQVAVADTNAVINLSNQEQAGYISFSKLENWTEDHYTAGSGIVFRLYRLPAGSTATTFDPTAYQSAGAWEKAELTLDTAGKATSGKLLLGTYIVTQITSPDTHKKVSDFTVVVSASGQTYTKNLVNEPIVGYVAITKLANEDDIEGTIRYEPNAEFAIYPSTYKTWKEAKSALVEGSNKFEAFTDYLITDANGHSKSNPMPYGEYRIEQIKSFNPNYAMVTPWTVNIGEDQHVYSYMKTNNRVPYFLRIVKSDSVTGIPLAGGKFSLYQTGNYKGRFEKPVLLELDGKTVWESNKEGIADLENLMLEIGTYEIREVGAPVGYLLNKVPYKFEIREDGSTKNLEVINQRLVYVQSVTNVKQKIQLNVIKEDAESKVALTGAEFELHYLDGAEDRTIGIYKTDDKGCFTVSELELGKYYLLETKAPDGYRLSSEKIYFEGTWDENGQAVITRDLTITNDKTAVLAVKTGEINSVGWMGIIMLLLALVALTLLSGHRVWRLAINEASVTVQETLELEPEENRVSRMLRVIRKRKKIRVRKSTKDGNNKRE